MKTKLVGLDAFAHVNERRTFDPKFFTHVYFLPYTRAEVEDLNLVPQRTDPQSIALKLLHLRDVYGRVGELVEYGCTELAVKHVKRFGSVVDESQVLEILNPSGAIHNDGQMAYRTGWDLEFDDAFSLRFDPWHSLGKDPIYDTLTNGLANHFGFDLSVDRHIEHKTPKLTARAHCYLGFGPKRGDSLVECPPGKIDNLKDKVGELYSPDFTFDEVSYSRSGRGLSITRENALIGYRKESFPVSEIVPVMTD